MLFGVLGTGLLIDCLVLFFAELETLSGMIHFIPHPPSIRQVPLLRTFAIAPATSEYGSARWCCCRWLFLGSAPAIASPAGLPGQ